MNIVELSVDDLKPYDNNPRKNDDAVPALAKSIEAFGFKVPIVIDKDNVVVTGHTRLKAAKSLGMKRVPCIIADDLTPEQIKAFRVVDNKVAELTEWDAPKLQLELDGLDGLDFDMGNFGFSFDAPSATEDEDELFPRDMRESTITQYNLQYYDASRTASRYNLPTLSRCDFVPEHLIGFNYVLNTEPIPGTAVHFYVDDYQFERVWRRPEEYLEKLAKWDAVLTPDFSLYREMPMAMKIWNVYRSRLIGQMMQDMGMKVIPTLTWSEEETLDFAFDGIEPGGVVSISTIGVKQEDGAFAIWKAGTDAAMKELHPSCVVVYGGDVGYEFPCKTVYIENDVTQRMRTSRKRKE